MAAYLTHTDDARFTNSTSAPTGWLLDGRNALVGGSAAVPDAFDRADIERPSGVVLYGGDGTWLRHSIDRAVFAGGLDEWHAVVVLFDAFTGADGSRRRPYAARCSVGRGC
ncbi:MAG: hypothetical protein R3F65_10220 [bacterium]